jgi:hypothetical protein
VPFRWADGFWAWTELIGAMPIQYCALGFAARLTHRAPELDVAEQGLHSTRLAGPFVEESDLGPA